MLGISLACAVCQSMCSTTWYVYMFVLHDLHILFCLRSLFCFVLFWWTSLKQNHKFQQHNIISPPLYVLGHHLCDASLSCKVSLKICDTNILIFLERKDLLLILILLMILSWCSYSAHAAFNMFSWTPCPGQSLQFWYQFASSFAWAQDSEHCFSANFNHFQLASVKKHSRYSSV